MYYLSLCCSYECVYMCAVCINCVYEHSIKIGSSWLLAGERVSESMGGWDDIDSSGRAGRRVSGWKEGGLGGWMDAGVQCQR